MVTDSQKKFRDASEEYHKNVMKDIELYAVTKYPFLEKKLRCDYRPSSVGTEEILVSLKVARCATSVLLSLKDSARDWEKRHKDAEQRLENWEEQAIRDAVSRAELPPFNIEG